MKWESQTKAYANVEKISSASRKDDECLTLKKNITHKIEAAIQQKIFQNEKYASGHRIN